LKFYRDNLDNHVLPALGNVRLSAIRRTHVNSLMRGLTGLGPLARQGVRRTLSACLAAAIDEELIELTPAGRRDDGRRAGSPQRRSPIRSRTKRLDCWPTRRATISQAGIRW
jgi:hypothetical protein